MQTNRVHLIGKNGMKLLATLALCFGLTAASYGGYQFYSVQGYAGPASAGGTDSLPGGAWLSIEASANGGTASVYVNGGGISRSGTVTGGQVISEAVQTSYAGSVDSYVYANGGGSYAFVEISW
jgi:hypothetical protein